MKSIWSSGSKWDSYTKVVYDGRTPFIMFARSNPPSFPTVIVRKLMADFFFAFRDAAVQAGSFFNWPSFTSWIQPHQHTRFHRKCLFRQQFILAQLTLAVIWYRFPYQLSTVKVEWGEPRDELGVSNRRLSTTMCRKLVIYRSDLHSFWPLSKSGAVLKAKIFMSASDETKLAKVLSYSNPVCVPVVIQSLIMLQASHVFSSSIGVLCFLMIWFSAD